MRHGFTGNLKTRNCDGLRKCEQKWQPGYLVYMN